MISFTLGLLLAAVRLHEHTIRMHSRVHLPASLSYCLGLPPLSLCCCASNSNSQPQLSLLKMAHPRRPSSKGAWELCQVVSEHLRRFSEEYRLKGTLDPDEF